MRTKRPALLAAAAALACLCAGWDAPGADVRHVPDPYPTIQSGINACQPGDTVLVDAGIYPENVIFPPADVIVASRYLTTGDPAWIDQTQIHSAAPDLPVVLIPGGQTRATLLSGFTITGGGGSQGSGVLCADSSPTIAHNRITNNCPWLDGGGIRVDLGGPEIRDNRIDGN
ncbi:MAG: hypothetical protein V1774_00595 [Candidatus Eisenbacteria bacterium]